MARILIIHSGLNGILNASFELAIRLELSGDECIISSPKEVGEIVAAQGFKYLQLDPINFDPAPPLPDFSGVFRKLRRLLHKIRFARERRKKAIVLLGMDSFLQKIKEVNPDQVIIDVELHEHIITLVAHDYDVKLLSQWFSLWKRKGLPPIVTDIIPGVGIRGSNLGIWWSWKLVRFTRWWMFYKKNLLSAATDRRSILLAYADSIGFSREYIKENNWPGPFVYDQLPVMSMTDESLEFPHDKRTNLEYVGSMVFEDRKDIQCPPSVDASISKLINRKKEEGKRLIYCSVSTFKAGDTTFIDKVIAAVSKNEQWMLVVGLGGLMSKKTDMLPSNIYAFDYVPQLKVLKEADLSINHGGIHTINECLHFNVPMLIYSGKRSDQNGCAARIHYHGKGIMGDKDKDGSSEIEHKISKMLTRKN